MKNNHLSLGSRRSFLKNVAKVGFSSGLLNSALAGSGLLWARGALAAESGVAPKRLITIHVTNGAYPITWHPTTKGTDFVLPAGAAPFEEVRQHCLFVDGLTGVGGHGPHHQCVTNDKPDSMDIYAAKKIGADTPFPSLHLAAKEQGGLSRVNNNSVPFELNPFKTYERLFPAQVQAGGVDWATIRSQGMLGMNLELIKDLRGKLNPVQQQRMDLHMESVAAVQKNILNRAAGNGKAACSAPFWGGSVLDKTNLNADMVDLITTEQRIDLYMEMMVMAMKCDLTRVATFSFGDSGATILIPGLKTNADWHGCQHGYKWEEDNPIARAWFSRKMVTLIKKLAAEPDVDGRTLLDNTLIYLTSDMGEGAGHTNERTPIILAGGLVKGGRAVDMGKISWDGIFDTVMAGVGIQLDAADYPKYGNGAGVYSGFLAS
jgi:Protein of unknown function (DUF1552)